MTLHSDNKCVYIKKGAKLFKFDYRTEFDLFVTTYRRLKTEKHVIHPPQPE